MSRHRTDPADDPTTLRRWITTLRDQAHGDPHNPAVVGWLDTALQMQRSLPAGDMPVRGERETLNLPERRAG